MRSAGIGVFVMGENPAPAGNRNRPVPQTGSAHGAARVLSFLRCSCRLRAFASPLGRGSGNPRLRQNAARRRPSQRLSEKSALGPARRAEDPIQARQANRVKGRKRGVPPGKLIEASIQDRSAASLLTGYSCGATPSCCMRPTKSL